MCKWSVGDRVEGGEPGTEDYDTGTVVRVDVNPIEPPEFDDIVVAWDSGVNTWANAGDLRPIQDS